jgi:hypothetical protein
MASRALAGTVLVFLANGHSASRADAPRGPDEFKAVVTPDFEGEWGTKSFNHQGICQVVLWTNGEPTLVFEFEGDRYALRFPPQSEQGTSLADRQRNRGD